MAKLKEGWLPVDRSLVGSAEWEKEKYVMEATMSIVFEAHCYKDGLRGKQQDYAKAMERFHKAADMGNPEAQYNLGVLYGSAINGPVESAKAVYYFNMATSQPLFYISSVPRLGVPQAHNALGSYYDTGFGVKRDLDKAFQHYKLSAEGDEPFGMSNLGVAYVEGRGTPVNIPKAIEMYTKAAEKNHPVAQYNLGSIYAAGYPGIEKNIRLARNWYSKAAANNHWLALVALEKSFLGSSPAESDTAEAMCMLGTAYEKGIDGQNPDVEQALHWFQKAAKQKLPMAQFRLGLLYLNKIPTFVEPKRISKGVKYIRDAAQLNNPQAQLMLSEFYQFGDYGNKRDIAKANSWLSKAKENGVDITRTILDRECESDIEFEKLLRRVQKWELSEGLTDSNASEPVTNQERIRRYSSSKFGKRFNDPERGKEYIEEVNTFIKLVEEIQPSLLHPVAPYQGIGDRYSLDKLAAYANTRVGDIMIAAKQHYLRGDVFLSDGKIRGFVYELFHAFKLCDIVCSVPMQLFEPVSHILQDYILENPHDAEAKFVLAVFSVFLKQPWSTALSLMDECVKLHPQESAFYLYRGNVKAFSRRYQDAISDFDVAVQILGPKNGYFAYYLRGAAKMKFMPPMALLDYHVYLEHAPLEDRKMSEVLFDMALCYRTLDMEKATEFYNRGLEAEAKRFPIFDPVDFSTIAMTESMLKMASFSRHMRKCSISMCEQIADKACSVCKKVWYCSKEHQKAHWKQHKLVCAKK
ncbi:hypothetical protein BC936DRAFT_144404 [Jimgerdemannia flammicorona]|uniref:MYND-type domain-containing protein n=1 Tax=Jimgerdemannia flammicorona TaxID=994334 RepID=A0A433DCL3_9FUNG|nr:hypothetical protein BC936DRAFT_144404 [Jimgerdemannia flammicorona]